METRDEFKKMAANAAAPPFPGEGPKQAGGPGLVPVAGRGRAAVGAAGAALKVDREGPPGRPLLRETLGEEAAVACGGGARGEHAGLVAVFRRVALVAAVAGKTRAAGATVALVAREHVGINRRV